MARYTYYPHTADVPEQAAVCVSGRSPASRPRLKWKRAPKRGFRARRRSGGHSLFVKDGKLRYAFNWVGT